MIEKGIGIVLLFGFILINCIFFSNISGQDIQLIVSRQGIWGPFVYMGLFAVLPAVFFPVAVLALGGGLAFGLLWGSVYTFIGALVNCALMFLLSRYVGRARISPYVKKRMNPKWQRRSQRLSSSHRTASDPCRSLQPDQLRLRPDGYLLWGLYVSIGPGHYPRDLCLYQHRR